MRCRSCVLALSIVVPPAVAGCEVDYNVANEDGSGGAGSHQADIEVSPPSLDFGSMDAGTAQSQAVTVRNVGTATLQLHSLTVEGPDSFQVLDDGIDRLLAPGEELELPVEYRPITAELAAGVLHIDSNDPDEGRVPVDLLATGLAPRIELTPASWYMGDWEIGCDTTTEILVRNTGTSTLVLGPVTYEPTSDELTLQDPGLTGASLEPGEERSLDITYQPADTLEDAGYLYIESNDPSNPRAMASQTATGHLADRIIDSFDQEGNNWTDILWVVDNSCSMQQEQDSLATNFSAFMGIVEQIDMNYHIGVVTTDEAGFEETDGSRYIDLTTPEPDDVFSQMVSVGTLGGGTEQGLKAAADALSSPYIDAGHPNEGFLRDEAGLRIIIVSDEEDQSGSSVGSYVEFYQDLKLNPDHVKVSGITGEYTGCTSVDGDADAAPRYMQAVEDTAGISVSICTGNWIDSLSELAWGAQSFQDTFPLAATPVVSSIEVYLNSVPMYEGWYYDGSLNSVLFEEGHIPDNGDHIDVAYNRLGQCGG